MALPFTSLDGVSVAGPGTARDLEAVAAVHSLLVVTTGAPTMVTAHLEGSHDGVLWTVLAKITVSGNDSEMATSSAHLVRYVRANLITLTGGSSPTVTASIASGDG